MVMKRMMFGIVMAAMVMGTVCVAYANPEEDAKALAQKAATFFKEQGKEKGCAEIMNPNGKLKKGKLFITANDYKGVVLASVVRPQFVGQNHYGLKDPNDKYFIQEGTQIAKKGGGWLEYSFTDPDTKKIVFRKTWVQPVEGMDVWLMAPVTVQ
jgi:cytochrome c